MVKSSFIANAIAAAKSGPKEIINWQLILYTCIWSFSGVAKGFDEGNIASLVTEKFFMKDFGLDTQSDSQYANTKGWIVSIATAGAVFGCLSAAHVATRFGPRITLQIFTLIYIAGILGQTFSAGNLAGLYTSRFIAGIGIGVTTILPPIYISEIAPRSIRGLLTLQYTSCQQLGVVFGFFFNYGITNRFGGTRAQWQLPTALQILPAVIWGVGTALTPQSPRYLLSNGKKQEALETLAKLRHLPADHNYVQEEFLGMEAQLEREAEAVAGTSFPQLVKEIFSVVSNRRRFMLIFATHVFSQWSGANATTQYSPTIFGYLGIQGEESRLLATGIYAVVKFVSTLLFAILAVDVIGRRRSLMTGICLQITTLTVVGAYLGATNGRSAVDISGDSSARMASQLAIAAIYLHAIAWSIGWFSIPYLVSAEVFPIRIRSLCVSVLMASHWAFYFGSSRATPSLLAATDRYGAFAFFASICSVSLVYVFFAMPETAGRSLESMDGLFERPWYTVWKVAYPKPQDLAATQPAIETDSEDKPKASHMA